MQQVIDTVVTSSDMSLDRVLKVALPVVLVFHDQSTDAEVLRAMDTLATRYAGRALIVGLARRDAPQAASRFGVRQYPAVVTFRDGNTLTIQQGVKAAGLREHAAFLLGEGPRPAAQPAAAPKREAAGRPVAVNEANFEQEVLRADRPVLLDFWAPWCGPCRMVEPTVEAMARDQTASLKVAKINVDDNPGLAARYGAMSIPTMIVMIGGREVDRWVGAMQGSALRSRVSRWLQQESPAT